jgi:hypothetical protein
MISIMVETLIIMGIVALVGAVLSLVGVMIGGWIMFKGKAGPGEGYLYTPKGDAFTIQDAMDAAQFPTEDEQNVLKRSEIFKKVFGD